MSKKRASTTVPADRTQFVRAASAAGLSSTPGLGALDGKHRSSIGRASKSVARITASVDVDASFNKEEPCATRWDYGIGLLHGAGRESALWVEPHTSCSPSEVKVMLAKLDWLKAKLETPEFAGLKLLTAASIHCGHEPFVWIATSTIAIRSGSREARQLALAGLKPPVRRLNI
ncbi:MAG TPA: hypothetical protein VIC30_01640 [Orrella sp.]